ncbi:MAG: metallophosphoesterase family protein [Candidatus Rokubacteria bacterium]|nr:metallophosphoesterase family protein [Candidatus Rokubacteria bacterium]
MRYALLSDIHGNLEAVTAVLDHLAGIGADALLCLGDMVGYGADPIPCVEKLAEQGARFVAGNHEHGTTGRLDLRWFNPYARAAALWTASRLDDAHRAFLADLPLVFVIEDATFVHASPKDPDQWEYLITAEDGFEVFSAFSTRLCFVGHSHRPALWSLGSSGREFEPGPGEIRLEPGRRYLVNVGSVGQPRDRDPRACYALWDPEAGRVVFHRVPYDVALAREKILKAGLPRFLGDRLIHGS